MAVASDELVEVARDYLIAFTNRDADTVERLSFAENGVLAFSIAIPPGVHDSLRDFLARMREVPQTAQRIESQPTGIMHNDFAWLVDFPKFTVPDGRVVSARFSVVLQRFGDFWKVVHSHLSIGGEVMAAAE
ncbi:nuclear transport factor 2 family protein [Streptomyces sp. NPDC056296]|uniref:nuclear transport factor 2 family protein n=1 Tax=Streptomyces sp. NPDC056296 TaxID=3345775 RepID=UPI0035DDBB20